MYNILIVDDQESSRQFMQYALASNEQYKVIGALADSTEAESFCRTHKVDLILMDIQTNGQETGLQSAKKVKAYNKNIKIIIVTFYVEQEHIKIAKKIGCEGFWYKDHSTITLSEVIDEVLQGSIIYPGKLPVIMIGCAKSSDFTKQELAVLKLLVNGASRLTISEKLDIQKNTVDYHIKNLKSKTGYDSLLKLAVDVSSKKFMIAEE